MVRGHPDSTRTDPLFPTRRSADLRGPFAFSHAWGPSTRPALMLTAAASPQAKILTFFRRDAYVYVYAKEVDMARKKSDSTPPREAKLFRNNKSQALRIPADFEFPGRSEEHTSELQSLMRISYAVFCLKK